MPRSWSKSNYSKRQYWAYFCLNLLSTHLWYTVSWYPESGCITCVNTVFVDVSQPGFMLISFFTLCRSFSSSIHCLSVNCELTVSSCSYRMSINEISSILSSSIITTFSTQADRVVPSCGMFSWKWRCRFLESAMSTLKDTNDISHKIGPIVCQNQLEEAQVAIWSLSSNNQCLASLSYQTFVLSFAKKKSSLELGTSCF